jgi:hypothetical protein
MLALVWTAFATAAPFQLLQPAHTLEEESAEMGASGGYTGALDALDAGQPNISAWGRYGIRDRLEVNGGAVLPLAPVDLVIHGGARYRPLGGPTREGFHSTVGASIGLSVTALRYPQFAFPLTIGFGFPTASVYALGALNAAASPLGAITYGSGELGVSVDAGTVPVYVAATYARISSFNVIGIQIGAGYNPNL